MDKSTLSNYGWVVIAVLVLSVMLALATPFGTYISNAVKTTTEGLFDVQQKAMGVAGLVIDDQEFNVPETNNNTQNNIPLQFGEKYNVLSEGQLVSISFNKTGSAEIYVNDELIETTPDGTYTYTSNGIFYTDTNELYAIFPYKEFSEECSVGIQDALLIGDCIAVRGKAIPVHWGKTYVDEQDGSTCIITGIHIKRVYPTNSLNTSIVFDSYNNFVTGSILDEFIWGSVSEDGATITINNRVYVLAE